LSCDQGSIVVSLLWSEWEIHTICIWLETWKRRWNFACLHKWIHLSNNSIILKPWLVIILYIFYVEFVHNAIEFLHLHKSYQIKLKQIKLFQISLFSNTVYTYKYFVLYFIRISISIAALLIFHYDKIAT
jgi:hypothetical protein